MSYPIDFAKKSLIIITGASRGIGQTIAVELSKRVNNESLLVLLARNEQGLNQTKALVAVNKVRSEIVTVDFSKPDLTCYRNILSKITTNGNWNKDIEYAICIHNAGTTGDLKHTTNLTDLQTWQDYFNTNVFSTFLFNTAFIDECRALAKSLLVVNVTSLCGRSPFKCLSMYGAGKAARELFFKVVAVEESDVVVLNYSPGPVDTDMFSGIIENAEDSEVRESFKSVKESSVLTPIATVTKLLSILEAGRFKNGDTIDYFDPDCPSPAGDKKDN